jgi:hypothetical protein
LERRVGRSCPWRGCASTRPAIQLGKDVHQLGVHPGRQERGSLARRPSRFPHARCGGHTAPASKLL